MAAIVVAVGCYFWLGRAPKPGATPISKVATPAAPQAEPRPARTVVAVENFDRRPADAGHELRRESLEDARAARRRAVDRLKTFVPGVRVDFDDVLGSPKFIASTSGFLATADGISGAVPAERMAQFAADDPQRAVKAFLEEYADLFGHGAAVLQDARVVRDYATERNGLRTIVWQQELEGLRIFESTFQAHVTKDGALVNIASRLVPDAPTAAKTGSPQLAARGGTPAIDAKRAVSEAAKIVGEELPPTRVAEAGEAEGPAGKQKFKSVPLLNISTEKVWLPVDETALKLAWEVIFTSKARGEMFRAIIDADDGTPLVLQGLTEYLTDASYRVWTSDSPSPFSPGNQTPVTTQPPVVARTLVTTGALNTTASPNGWIDDGVNELRGNNVDAHTDLNADDIADTPRPVGSPFRVFDFPVDLTQAPSTYTAAAITDLFYWNNLVHDRFYELGFTEAAGNFQNNNFGRGGVGGDAVQADAQDGYSTNNANFSTPPDGSPGRMQMFVFTGPTPDRDGDFDHEVVIHEATHGLSNRLVGGGVGLSALQSRGMGEGWSDFYALCLLSEPTDDPNAAYAKGGYATYQLSAMTTNYYYGIRRYPYSTDLSKNPLTFKDIDPILADAHTGIPLSPRYPSSNVSPSLVHGQGELWCVTLWEARSNLIAKHGTVAGNKMILELVTDGMKLSPANPTFLQSRDAILQADLVDNGGANHAELWKAFAKRGMGLSAVAPSSSTTTGVQEAYDVPGVLTVSPGVVLALTGKPGGPFTPASTVYTLKNTGTAAINWTVTKAQSWLNVSPASGTLAPQATVQATVTVSANANSLAAGLYTDTLTFDYAGNTQSVVNRAVTLSVKAAAPPAHPGWPNSSGGEFNTVADLNNDGKLEVLSGRLSTLQIFKQDGTVFSGWPKTLTTGVVGPPSVADLDGDGTKEISVIVNNFNTRYGDIYLWKPDGTAVAGWPKNFPTYNSNVSSTISPVLADMDSDGKLDIIYNSATSATGSNAIINVAKMDGTAVSGWPVTLTSSGGAVQTSPAVADFDGDGQLDIAVVTYGGRVYVYRQNGTLFTGFPVTLGTGGNFSGNVTFADLNHDGRLELIAAVYGGQVGVYNSSGQLLSGWPKTIGTIPRPPGIADLDGDGDLEMAFGTQDGYVQVLHHTGVSFQGWPQTLPNRGYSPAIADLDDDGKLDIVTTDGAGNLNAWDRLGNPLSGLGFPFNLGTAGNGPPVVADLDGNGTAEVISYSSTLNIRALPSQLRPATTPWPVMFQDSRSLSRYSPAPGPITMEPSRLSPGATAQVVITGDRFLKGMKVVIDGVPQVVTAETATTITVTVAGLNSTGSKSVVLSNANFGAVTYANSILIGWPLVVTAPVSANEGAGVLVGQGSVTLAAASVTDTVVTLQSSDSSEVTVPASVTVPAGQTSATFDTTIVDDAQIDGSQTAVITGTGPNLGSGTANVIVHDNETATLSLNIPASANEGAGTVQGTLNVSTPPAANVAVALTSSVTGEAQVPASVSIPAGQTAVTFPVTIMDDGAIDGPQVTKISAHVANWTDGSANLTVIDNETTSLTLSLPAGLREGDAAQTGSVSISGTLPNALVVSLSSDDTSEVTVPSTVTIPAGQTTAAFSLTSIDDALTDGAQTVSLTASTSGFSNATATITVADNDVHHFTFGPIGNPQDRGIQFAVMLTAQDINGATITNYAGVANLTAAGSGGSVGVTPSSTTGGFLNGIWNGVVKIDALGTQVVLTANDGSGHLGTSNPFDVIEGAADHFSWDTIASPQTIDTPLQVTLRALDAGNGPVSAYHGSPDLFALLPSENATIGTGTSSAVYPLYTYTHDLRTQILYTASEVGAAARLTALALNVTSVATAGEPLTNLTIRLKHTTKTSLASGSAWDNTGWTTVYRASPTISAAGWVTFNFTTPFDFDGTNNLLIDLSMDRTSSNSNYTYLQNTSTSQTFTIYATSNSTNGDPLTWSGTAPYANSYAARPNLRFTTLKEIPIRPQRSGAFSSGVWTGEVSVPISGTLVSLGARAGTVSGVSNSFTVTSPTPPSNGGATVYAEDFESGVLPPAYWTITGTGNFRTQVTNYLPRSGSKHLAMDEALNSAIYARNEATLTLNLAGRTNVQLSFWAAQFGEDPHGPPASPFPSTGANFDGVAISADGGNNWYEVQPLRSLTGTYTKLTVDLDAALAARGLNYSSSFKIRFNQYDDYSLGTDGIGIDDILVTANPTAGFVINAPTQVTEGDGNTDATIVLDSAAATDTVVTLASSAPAKITVPATATIPAGQTTATFSFGVLDDTIPDGDRTVTISGTIGSNQRGATVTVRDNEALSLTLSAPASMVESATGQNGTVTVSGVVAGPVTISLASSDTTEITVPASVVIPAGQKSVSFPITFINDTEIDGTQDVTITASRTGWTNATATVQVTDNETRNLALSGPLSVYEGNTSSGTVSISGTLPTSLVVTLTSSNPAQYYVPATVTIPAGQTSVSFLGGAAEDSATDGTQAVTITASASTFVNASVSVSAYDNDIHHFTFGTVPTSVTLNQPFSVSVSARDVNNSTITVFSGTVNLSASARGTAVPMTPAVSGNFSAGVWTGSVKMTGVGTGVTITAADSANHSGTSGSFNVSIGAVSGFTWSAVPSSVTTGTPISTTVAATDAYGNTITNFNSSASISCETPARTVGTGTVSIYQPFTTGIKESRTQCIYLASELGGAGKLKSLALDVATVPGLPMTRFTIRIKPTTLASYSTGNWESTGWTTVFQGNVTVTKTGWITLPFITPYQYDGTSNLMVDFSFYNSSSAGIDGYVRSTLVSNNRAVFSYSSATNGDPLTWFGSTPYGNLTSYIPNLRLRVESSIPVSPATITFVNGIWSGPLTVGGTGIGLVLSCVSADLVGDSNTFNSSSAASLAVSPTGTSTSTGTRGGPFNPLTHTFTVSNGGSGSMAWTASSSAAWLSVSPGSGTLQPGASATVTATLGASTVNLPAGNNSATITFTNTTNGVGSTTRPVTVSATAIGELAVTPETIFEAVSPKGGVASPSSQIYVLKNTGDANLNWTAAEQIPWLSLSATSGTLAPNQSTNVVASVNAVALEVGSYSGAITFTNTTSGRGTTSRSASLIVTLPAPSLSPEPATTPGTSNTISWSTVTGAQSYEAEIATRPDFADARSTGWLTATSYSFDSLIQGTQYYYRVRARRITPEQPGTWSQTAKAEFDLGNKVSVNVPATGGVTLASGAGGILPDRPANASFELGTLGGPTIDNWTADTTNQMGADSYASPISPMPSAGSRYVLTYSHYRTSHVPGDYARVTQSVDLTGASTLMFDAVLRSSGVWSGSIIAEARIDGVTVWNSSTQGSYLNQSVNVAAYTGVHNLEFRLKMTVAGTFDSQWAMWDNVRLVAPNGTYVANGTLTTPEISPSPWRRWGVLNFTKDISATGTALTVDVLKTDGTLLNSDLQPGTDLDTLPAFKDLASIRLRANLSTSNLSNTPRLVNWSLAYIAQFEQTFLSPWSASETSVQINAPPVVSHIANQTVLEDGLLSALPFSIGDDSTPAGNLLVSATSSNPGLLPTSGLLLGGSDAGRTIQPTLVPNANGTAMVTVRVTDDMGEFSEDTFEVVVRPVNDPPSFTAGSNQNAPRNSGPRSVVGWASNLSAGAPDEAGQTRGFLVTNDLPGIFSTQPAISADGTLTFTPSIETAGVATVSVRLRDNGGSNDGGDDTSPVQTFTISTIKVNNAPTFVAGDDLEVAQDAGLQTVPNWATQMNAGSADEAGQLLDFQVKISDHTLFARPPTISPEGTLIYAPAPGVGGIANVTVRLHDNGGTENGGHDLSDAKTFTIAITNVADRMGSYNGLVRAVDPAASTAEQFGLIQLNVVRTGKFTGKLTIGGKAQSLTGSFDQAGVGHFGKDGATAFDFKRTSQPALRVTLQLDVATASDRLSGTIENESGPFAVIAADRSLFSTQKVLQPPFLRMPAERLGAYTALFNPPASELSAGQIPPGHGSASVVVSASGSVRMVATLADGTKFTYSNFLSKSFEWPLHFASATAGCINGPVQFLEDEIKGPGLSWFRPVTNHATYPQGWPVGILTELIGSKYLRPTAEAPLFTDLPIPDETGNILVTLTEGGLADDGILQAMNVVNGSKMTAILPNTNRVAVTLTATTGLLSGSFKHPETGKSTKFTGAILQKQGFGAGSFSSPQVGGCFYVAPRSTTPP